MADVGGERDALGRHRAEVDDALASQDAARIKGLYRRLGDYLADEFGDAGQGPQLSYAETAGVVIDALGSVDGVVLDAGCGPRAVASELLASKGVVSISLDIGHGTVALAREGAASRGLRVIGVVGDVEHLPFRAGVFGGVVSDDTIEHLPDDLSGLREICRVLTPAGRAVIATPNRRRIDVVAGKVRDLVRRSRRPTAHYYAATSHLREYTHRELLDLARRAGLGITGRAVVPWPPDRRWKRIANRALRGPLSGLSRVVVVVLERKVDP